MDRRVFLRLLALTVAAPACSTQIRETNTKLGSLRADPDGYLDLPAGYHYKIVSAVGMPMNDGLLVPGAHDGMAAFAGNNGRIVLVCNHELGPSRLEQSAFSGLYDQLPETMRSRLYDRGGDATPGNGGTTTVSYNPHSGKTEDMHLSLAGTEWNCSGGPTPWGSWLSCEEYFGSPGMGLSDGEPVTRDKSHGYVFEVAAGGTELLAAQPIKAMGRFEHEAAAVHAASGIVYMTEDQHHSLFYRYIPNVPGKLLEGGRLQALAIVDRPSFSTHNWSDDADVVPGQPLATHWIDLDDVNSDKNDLRHRGKNNGAATFARGEGLCSAAGDFAFTCTIGGPERLGQVFSYRPSPMEGQAEETDAPGQLTLIAESSQESILRNADNLTLAPWGDLIVCEDTATHCGLVGIRPDGSQYQLADNPYSDSELSGVCFAPDGKTLFVNIQYPGMTLAITGPFPS